MGAALVSFCQVKKNKKIESIEIELNRKHWNQLMAVQRAQCVIFTNREWPSGLKILTPHLLLACPLAAEA